MQSHKDLLVWQKSMELTELVYKVTKNFPADERFNITSQLRRSAVSIPSNISEGHGRKTDGEFNQFLRIAFGSSSELETQIILANRLKFIPQKETEVVLNELISVRKMLNKLISTIAQSKREALKAKSKVLTTKS